ncbi:DUF4911 domain-containing protein [Sandaracinus amylolyticus]|uniref:DUF4911 domain-containing protein n=1 Tax=Sandaracinus amylolyticus TaxID=927083 RepID=UPI001F19D20D|nr:DUF4911 domain-containing protein [Sandaracinus amylolyticus]UJR81942.1 Hypothetical protein I5071_40070 [Sandaracinus amylolyticus]
MSDPIDGASHVPLGEGLVVRRLRMQPSDIVRLRGILAGYDGLASAHGDRTGVVVLVTTTDREAELDEWLEDVAREIDLEIL